MKSILTLAAFIVFTLLGNFFFKRAAMDLGTMTFSMETLVTALRSVNAWAGVIFYGTAAIFWMAALTTVPLNLAVTASISSYVLIVLMAFFFFQEPISAVRWAGIGMVVAGLALVGWTA